MPRNYATAFPAFVNLTIGSDTLKYGFKCRLQDTGLTTKLTDLGITRVVAATLDVATLQGFVLGCNAPKPNRATKLFDNSPPGYESSFISTDKIGTARANGWKVTPAQPFRKAVQSPRSQTVFVTINGIKYAWQSPKLNTAIESQVALGDLRVQVATNATTGLVFGASFPKPPVATKAITDPEDGSIDNYSTFYDPSHTLPAGWSAKPRKGTGRYSLADLQAMV